MIERRKVPFSLDEEKFSTQKVVTYMIFLAFYAVIINVLFMTQDQSERSMILQTVINLTFLAAGFWIGTSKGAADARDQMAKMLQPQPESKVTTTIETPAEPAK